MIPHPYKENNPIYNFVFHPFHDDNKHATGSIILNIFLTIITGGAWQILFWIINRWDDRKIEPWLKNQPMTTANTDLIFESSSVSDKKQAQAKEIKASDIIINEKPKQALNKIFEDTPYSLDKLPIHPKAERPSVEEMTHPIMRGVVSDPNDPSIFYPFIAIKVESNFAKKVDISKVEIQNEKIKAKYSSEREKTTFIPIDKENLDVESIKKLEVVPLKRVVFLWETPHYGSIVDVVNDGEKPAKLYWREERQWEPAPVFFQHPSITDIYGNLSVDSQKGLNALNTIVKGEKGPDGNGVYWTLGK